MQLTASTLLIQWPSHHLHEIKKWTTGNTWITPKIYTGFKQSRTRRRPGLMEEVDILLWSEFSPKETKENILLLLGKSIGTLASRAKSYTKNILNIVSVLSFLCANVRCCCSVTKSCLTLCSPMNCSTPGFPVLHYLPEFAQIHVHWAGNAIQLSHPLSPPSPIALNLSQHQGLFQWAGSSHQMGTGLVLQLQHQSFQWIFTLDFL